MKKYTTDATIQKSDDPTMGVVVRRSSGVVRQVVTSTGQLDKPFFKKPTSLNTSLNQRSLPNDPQVFMPA
jgi:hypothetical protein